MKQQQTDNIEYNINFLYTCTCTCNFDSHCNWLTLYYTISTFKGVPSDRGRKNLQKYKKIILILPKPSDFHS